MPVWQAFEGGAVSAREKKTGKTKRRFSVAAQKENVHGKDSVRKITNVEKLRIAQK
jgi:hypothetical protein